MDGSPTGRPAGPDVLAECRRALALGEMLRERRNELRLTQGGVLERAGYSSDETSSISKAESGAQTLSREKLADVVEVLGLGDVDRLLMKVGFAPSEYRSQTFSKEQRDLVQGSATTAAFPSPPRATTYSFAQVFDER